MSTTTTVSIEVFVIYLHEKMYLTKEGKKQKIFLYEFPETCSGTNVCPEAGPSEPAFIC